MPSLSPNLRPPSERVEAGHIEQLARRSRRALCCPNWSPPVNTVVSATIRAHSRIVTSEPEPTLSGKSTSDDRHPTRCSNPRL